MKLTRENADALCTIIAFGFFNTEKADLVIQSEYPMWDDAEEYKFVLGKYADISGDKSLTGSYAPLKEHLPYVLAKNPDDADGFKAQERLTGIIPFIEKLFEKIQKEKNSPYGAYIGGMYDGKTVHIVGPSAMGQYPPAYRLISDEKNPDKKDSDGKDSIEQAFKKSKDSSTISWKCIEQVIKEASDPFPNDVEITPIDEAFDNGEPYRNGLFKSYHGMVQAMSKYPPNEGNVLFEIALGDNTTKVGACIPCSIYMFANGRTPSSTHLGRGDNWNIPDIRSAASMELKDSWRRHVQTYYDAGITLFNRHTNMFFKIECWKEYFNNNDFIDVIPEMFLEALTFEGKFTDKIKDTLAIPIPL
ncbi:MAG: hypothetical protein LBC47_09735 [Tannerella sp.]|jgi:hypothetical protein|nr:hypothetical protein [Tannerella sp.]